MTRTLFFLMSLAAMLAAMTSVVLRIELAYPGVSPLFLNADGNPDGARYNLIVTAHTVFAYLAVMLLGTTMAAAARSRGARMTTPLIWIGIALCVALTCLLIASEIGALSGPTSQDNVGWVLYPPLSTSQPSALLEQAFGLFGLDPLAIVSVTQILMLPAAFLLLTGAFAMLSTEPRFASLPVLGILITLLALMFVAQSLMGYDTLYATSTFHLAFWPLLTFAAIRLIDAAPDWLVLLTVGMLACMVAHFTTLSMPQTDYAAGTHVETALAYIFPLGLAFYALPALILFARRPALPGFAPWAIGAAITVLLTLWLLPLLQLGWQGQPARYMDYPTAFAASNLSATTGSMLFIALYLALITLLRRQPET